MKMAVKNERYCSGCGLFHSHALKTTYHSQWYRREVAMKDGKFNGIVDVPESFTYHYCNDECRRVHKAALDR